MNIKLINKLIKVLFLVIILLIIMTQLSFALDTSKYTNIYKEPEGGETLISKGGKILGIVQSVGTSISVIMLTIIGIIYVTSSPDKKAELKQRLIIFTIGAILLFAASNIMSIVAGFARESSGI